MPIREACRKDVPAMLSIYAYFVRETAVSFEYEPPSPEEFACRLEEHSAQYPWLVGEEEERVLGYAYAGLPFERAAYRWCAEISCYLAQEARGRGVGRKLFGAMRRDYGTQVFTVSSSPYAAEFYRCLGFVPTDTEQLTGGLRYIPMEFSEKEAPPCGC